MKKYLFTLAILSFALFASAQSKIDDYQSSYFKKSYDINASQNKTDTSKYDYYIDCASADKLHQQVCLIVHSKEHAEFVDYLNTNKQIYDKWNKTARANNVTELDKDIETKGFKCSCAFVYGEWNFDFNVLITSRVKIVNGKMYLIFSSGTLQSSSNQFMKHDGLLLVFSSPEEIDDFISKTDLNNARKFFASKNKTDQLFKN